MQAGGDSYSISSAQLNYGPVDDLLTAPRIIDVVADMLGEHVIAWRSYFYLQNAHDDKRGA